MSASGVARINGIYFYHPDHLGSITMITDGNGKVLAGGERGVKSHITYKPYGEILRTDSYGPDITKFKFTGQEEDKESGLYFYKARYYDAALGRFASNDGMAFPKKTQGMNRIIYVEGDPIAYLDPDGNSTCAPKGGSVWAGNYVGPGGGGCAGSYLYSDYTDLQGALNPKSPLFGLALHIFFPDDFSQQDIAIYYGLLYLKHNPTKNAQSKSDEISSEHDQEFGVKNQEAFSESYLKCNGKWIGRNLRSLFSPRDWKSTYDREKNAISDRKTPWGKKRGRYGDATPLVAGINTLGTRGSDILVTGGGIFLFTMGGNPFVIGATVYASNADRLKIRPNRFKLKL